MAGFDCKVRIKVKHVEEARDFLNFLKRVANLQSHPVKINFRYLKRGFFYLSIDGQSGAIDAFFQGIILNKGLFYYSQTLNKKSPLIKEVVLPICKGLLEERFVNPHSAFLRKHILGKISQNDFVPSDIKNYFGYKYEILFRKWDLKMIDDKEFVINLDALLTKFLLTKIQHKREEKSPKFNLLVDSVSKIYLLGVEVSRIFKKIHGMRTKSLHRLSNIKNRQKLIEYSITIYSYFQYLDDYIESQQWKTYLLKGVRYKRVRYGNENKLIKKRLPHLFDEYSDLENYAPPPFCGDCGVLKGEFHVEGCDVELCAKCGGQFISYDCGQPS